MMALRSSTKAFFGLVAGVAVLGAVSQAAASTFETTVTYTGTITSGGEFDSLNTIEPYYYGCPSGCGLGTAYALVFTFDSPPGSLTTTSASQTITGGGTAVLTINGHKLFFTGALGSLDTVGINGSPPNFNFSQGSDDVGFFRYARQSVGSAHMQLLPVFTNVSLYTFVSGDTTPQGSVAYDVGPNTINLGLTPTTITVTANEVGQTPLPAAFPLFATGLGVMGLLARRRTRKNAAAIAAA
jgi:hypothetical protein